MYNKNETCCFTGHRNIPTEALGQLRRALEKEVLRAYGLGIRSFIAGGALGFDMLAAHTVLALKSTYPDVKLTVAVPCRDHDAKWSAASKDELKQILAEADRVTYVSEAYDRGCMFRRNRYMVDRSCICISYCTRSTGGSRYTVNYAHSCGVSVWELSEQL